MEFTTKYDGTGQSNYVLTLDGNKSENLFLTSNICSAC